MQHGAAAEDVVTPSPASAISASRGEYQAHPCTDRYRLCGDAHDLRPVELSMGANVVTALSDAHFVKLYTDVLMRLCNANGMNAYLPDKHDKVSIFYSTFRQPFSLESYVTRIVNFTNCSRSVFVNALVYLDRIKQTDPRLAISEMNVHRVLMTAVVLSVKFLEDELYQNSYFAKVGGIQTVAEFNRLEGSFLSTIGWTVYVEQDEYNAYEERLGAIFTYLGGGNEGSDCTLSSPSIGPRSFRQE